MEKVNKIGIFILNYNGLNWLKKTLTNIVKYSPNVHIIIIDNNSNDGSITYVKEKFSELEIIRYKKNYGFSKGYNKALLTEKRFQYFLIINNDLIVTHNWINPMLELIKKNNIGIVQPKIMNLDNRQKFDYAGGAGGFIDTFGIPFCRGRLLNNIEEDYGQYNNDIPIFWASGCCLLIESELFQSLNGFDEDLFMHQEEIDLCWRAWGKNKKSYYCAKSTVYHHGGGTLRKNDFKKHYYNHRNNLLIILKNLDNNLIYSRLPIRIIFDYCIILYHIHEGIYLFFCNIYKKILKFSIIQEKTLIIIAILQAHYSFLKLYLPFLRKRKAINSKLIQKGSLIFNYYIRNRKKFSDLK